MSTAGFGRRRMEDDDDTMVAIWPFLKWFDRKMI